MGIIILLTSMDRYGVRKSIMGSLAGNKEVYIGYEPNWYADYGNKICQFIFMSSFILNSKEIIDFVIATAKRMKDRSFKLNLKLDPDDLDCDLPNSKIRIQSDLENLYMGKIFRGEKAYSRMMSTFFVILTYSSGMPIMYVIGFVFYLVTYNVHKFLITQYYQKSRTLTRTIPLFAMQFLAFGLFSHIINGTFMLTNPLAFETLDNEEDMESKPKPYENLIVEKDGTFFRDYMYSRTKYLHQQIWYGFIIGLIITVISLKWSWEAVAFIITTVTNCIKVLVKKIKIYLSRKARIAKKKLSESMKIRRSS